MGTALAFSSVSEAIDIARAALGYLAAADAARLAADEQADCLRKLERTDAAAAARASFLAAFTVGKVLDALSAPAGAEDTRSREQRYHDALQEAMR